MSRTGEQAIEVRAVVLGGGDRASVATTVWRAAGFEVDTSVEHGATDGPVVLHLVATLLPSPGALGAAAVARAAGCDVLGDLP